MKYLVNIANNIMLHVNFLGVLVTPLTEVLIFSTLPSQTPSISATAAAAAAAAIVVVVVVAVAAVVTTKKVLHLLP
jgi:hypothetical protein